MQLRKRMILRIFVALLSVSCLVGNCPKSFAQENNEETMESSVTRSEMITVTADIDLPGNDELFAGYAWKQLYGSAATPFGIMAGERLNAPNKGLYAYLKQKTKLVADGELAYTVFEISEEELNEMGFRTAWTMEELDAQDGAVIDAVFFEQIDLNGVWEALGSDCAYELYWYNKALLYEYGRNIRSCAGKYEVYIANLTIKLPVAAAYLTGTDEFHVDTVKTAAASKAAANARKIVDKYAGASDYEKLLGYKKEICDLVAYDFDALNDPNAFLENSNPWHLINVFDGDAYTNVVCEGYAKAFAYLCDLSTFEGDVTCCNVVGWSGDENDGGPHMWNIVSIEGQNYLVDVTNSDDGMIGQDGGLFLAGTPKGSVTQGYWFSLPYGTVAFQYEENILNFWGTGDDSVLKLADADYVPGVQEPEDEEMVKFTKADLTGDGNVDEADAQYLLWHTLMPTMFPVDESLDLNLDDQSGITDGDALELLWYTLMH